MRFLSAVMAVIIIFMFAGCGVIIINDFDKNETTELTDTEITSVTDTETISTTYIPPETNRPVKPIENKDNRIEAEKYLNELPNRDFNNIAVLITSTEIVSLVPQSTEDFIYNTRIERNQDVEEKFNTRIIGIENSYDTIYDNTYKAVYSGDYYTDIIGIPSDSIGQFYANGLLMNLNMLPFIDVTKPYIDNNAVKQMSAGKGIYGIIGDFNKNMDYYYVMYFNKTLIKELGIENPYDLVYENNWTLDKFREMTQTVPQIYGTYGHGSVVSLERYIDMFFQASGEKYMDTGVGVSPELRYNNKRTENIVAKLRSLIYSDGTVFDGTYTSENARTTFYNGNMLFYIDRVNVMSWFVDMKDDWGVVPIPKLDKAQAYNTFIHEAMPVICVPSRLSNIDNTGLAIQALNAASYGYINENYYAILQRDVVRDSDTLNMLDYINSAQGKGRISVDFAYMFGGAYSYIADGTYRAVRSAVMNNYSISSLHDRHYNNIVRRNVNAFPTE